MGNQLSSSKTGAVVILGAIILGVTLVLIAISVNGGYDAHMSQAPSLVQHSTMVPSGLTPDR
jgi:hypothetical protein